METEPALTFKPADASCWQDIEALFGSRGARDGCWCMRWRLPRQRFEAQKGEANRQAFRDGVVTGRFTGLLAYRDDSPVAWCSIGPREQFPMLAISELLAPVDDRPVWSVTCFFVSPRHRRSALTVALLKASADYARSKGARMVEGYPLIPTQTKVPVAAGWTGFASAFVTAGFEEVARRNELRPIMRLDLSNSEAPPQESIDEAPDG